MNLFQGLCLLIALAIVGFVAFRAYLSWRAANPATASTAPTVGIPRANGEVQFFDITPAAPCPTNHGCKFVMTPPEKCLLTEAEKAVATLGEFAPRAKAISKKVRGELQAQFDFAEAATP